MRRIRVSVAPYSFNRQTMTCNPFGKNTKPDKKYIAYTDLQVALFVVQVFAKHAPNCFFRLNSDNESEITWLNKVRGEQGYLNYQTQT